MNETTPLPADSATEPTFDALALGPDVRRAIDAMGYQHPTPVQRAVFEPAVEGRSLIVQARTGTGKTAAFGLPLVDRLVRPNIKAVQAMVLCPTRELALQVGREIELLGQFRGIKVAAIYGGASMTKQIEAIAGGAHIVAGTPGRVLDHLRQRTLDPANIKVLILDEADEMLSMGFARELSAILELLPKNRQGLFFSATLPPDIERLAQAHLREPELITLSSDQVGALEIEHYVYVLRDGDKISQLVRILEVEDPESAIVFCNTRDETQRVAEALKARGFDADWLNGDLPQSDRERVMNATREGRVRFLVATDVAARGIDISHLTHVINHDFPETAEQYVHRTGRTGRAGRTGTAIAIVGPKDIGNLYLLRLTYKIRPIERQLPSAGEMKTRAELDLLQLFVDAFRSRTVHPDDLSLARRLLTHDDGEKIVAGLLRDHLGARGGDAPTEAAEARRARNPTHAAPKPPLPPPAPAVAGPQTILTRAFDAAPVPAYSAPGGLSSNARGGGQRGAVPLAPANEGGRPRSVTSEGPSRPPRRRAEERAGDREGRRAEGAAPSRWEPPQEPDDDEPILEKTEDRSSRLPGVTVSDARPAAEAAPFPDAAAADAFAQVFINVGVREGLRAAELQALLAGKGIGPDETNGIRIRDRMSFVTVRRALVDRVITALAGQVIGGRTVIAELARAR